MNLLLFALILVPIYSMFGGVSLSSSDVERKKGSRFRTLQVTKDGYGKRMP